MPTVSWIRESRDERFARSQPNSIPSGKLFSCQICKQCFSKATELSCHLSQDHPHTLPVLYLRRQPLIAETVQRVAVDSSEIELLQCTSCEVKIDGGDWLTYSLQDFQQLLSQATNSTWDIRLLNVREADSACSQQQYRICFRIPDAGSLDLVEEHFLNTLVKNELTHFDLKVFEGFELLNIPASDYRGALGDYALGVILKEGRGTQLSPIDFGEFQSRMQASLDILQHFRDRPVALAVCSCIRFNLNDFRDYGVPIAMEVEDGLEFFRSLTDSTADEDSVSSFRRALPNPRCRPICPVDRITSHLLAACACFSKGGSFLRESLNLLENLPECASPVSVYDLTKIHAICAEGFLRLQLPVNALPHFQALQYDPMFRKWAKTVLDRRSQI